MSLSTTSLQRLFFLGDVHSPFTCERSWRLVLEVLADFKPDVFVSLGDFVDCFTVSSYSKGNERLTTLKQEILLAREKLDELEARTPGARRIWLDGNHEFRLVRYLQDKAPQLLGLVEIKDLLKLEQRGWEYVPYKQSIQLGKLHVAHDVGNAGRYNVFKVLDTFQAPVVTGHTHRLAYVVEGDATGDTQVGAQFGWLGDVDQVDYMHRIKAKREWSRGFGYGYLHKDTGYAYIVPVPIVDYTAIVEGRFYDGRAKTRARRRAA